MAATASLAVGSLRQLCSSTPFVCTQRAQAQPLHALAACHPRTSALSRVLSKRAAAVTVRCASSSSELAQLVKEKIDGSSVVVFSKSYCPYCTQVKGLFKSLGVKPLVLELDEIVEGNDIQDTLYDLTSQRTVPNVFIGGKHIGGCDDTTTLHRKGELLKLLEAAGVSVSS